jgi:hypothetical protein
VQDSLKLRHVAFVPAIIMNFIQFIKKKKGKKELFMKREREMFATH